MGITVVGLCSDDFTCLYLTFGGYTHSTTEPSALPLRVTAIGKFVVAFGCGTWKVPLRCNCIDLVKYRSDPSTPKAVAFYAQDDNT